jgi:ribose 5-phosphate isomerase B
MKIALGADHGGFLLKKVIRETVTGLGHDVEDFGCDGPESVDYPDYAEKVARGVSDGTFDRGILICGTGIGMSIAANKFPNVRAALCHNVFTARLSREHNDANLLTMGERVIGSGIAQEMVKVWLETKFEGGRHARRVEKIGAFDRCMEKGCR